MKLRVVKIREREMRSADEVTIEKEQIAMCREP